MASSNPFSYPFEYTVERIADLLQAHIEKSGHTCESFFLQQPAEFRDASLQKFCADLPFHLSK